MVRIRYDEILEGRLYNLIEKVSYGLVVGVIEGVLVSVGVRDPSLGRLS